MEAKRVEGQGGTRPPTAGDGDPVGIQAEGGGARSWDGDTKCINVPPRRSSEVEGKGGCRLSPAGAPAVSSLGDPTGMALPETARWEGPWPLIRSFSFLASGLAASWATILLTLRISLALGVM